MKTVNSRKTLEGMASDLFATVRKIGYPIEVLNDYTETMTAVMLFYSLNNRITTLPLLKLWKVTSFEIINKREIIRYTCSLVE